MKRAFCSVLLMKVHQCSDVDIAHDVAVHHNKRVVNARKTCGERNGTCGVEWLWFYRVVQLDAGALALGERLEEGLRLEPDSENYFSDSGSAKVGDEVL